MVVSLTLACGGDSGPTGPVVRTPTAIALVSGSGQTGPVGTPLPTPVVVRVTDAQGPMAGITVSFAPTEGNGGGSPQTAVTLADGTAQTTWILGTVPGTAHRLQASVQGLTATVSFSATAELGPPAAVAPTGVLSSYAVVARPTAIPLAVRVTDLFDNPVAGVAVTFSVTEGGGSATGTSAVSGTNGVAQVGSWTLGPAPGINRMRATITGGSFTEVIAIGTAAAVTVIAGNNQSANAGTLVPVRPAVLALDGDGSPLAGVPVTFTAAAGSGTVQNGVVLTDAAGVARPGSWTLSLAPGLNQMQATPQGLEPVLIVATGLEAVPAALVAEPFAPLSGFAGNFLSALPEVVVRDAGGNPVAGAYVSWEVTEGAGTVPLLLTRTDALGRARAPAWRLGPSVGLNRISARVVPAPAQGSEGLFVELPPVNFEATSTLVPPGAYQIELRFTRGEPTPSQRAAFESAVLRWQQLILGDVPDIPVNQPPATSGCFPALNETIDDLVIYVVLEPIDGPGGILGQAGPCLIRNNGGFPLVGLMQFDPPDLITLENDGRLEAVILHEMGHVIGMPFLWNRNGLSIGRGGGDPHFVGPTALSVFPTLFGPGNLYTGTPVPLENTGGGGTRDSHWRESVLRNELMTGFINAGVNPLSALSVVSLRDVGYIVNDALSDQLTILPAAFATFGASGSGIWLVEGRLPDPIIALDHRGRPVATIPR